MSKNEHTSEEIAKLASKYINFQFEDIPKDNVGLIIFIKEIRAISASCLTQCKDKEEIK